MTSGSVFALNLFNRLTLNSTTAHSSTAHTILEDCMQFCAEFLECTSESAKSGFLCQAKGLCEYSAHSSLARLSNCQLTFFACSSNIVTQTAVKVDQFVPICSDEVNSSPVFPGYWPSQQEPPANPYRERMWEGGEGGPGSEWDWERKTGRPREKWASADYKCKNEMKARRCESSKWGREMRKVELVR